ncbi:MAG: hypothetical protein Q7W30_08630 [Coriobacteriia bacterium]|nr:hypothetical protein [Coriobacteriia bacterium]
MRPSTPLRLRTAFGLGLAGMLAMAAVGCAPPSVNIEAPAGAVTETPSAEESQAPIGEGPGDAESATDAAAPGPIAPAGWPVKVGTFAKKFAGPTWYPVTVPKGFAVDMVDVLELEPGAGLICDVALIGGEKYIGFIQGSPKTREYPIVSVGKVPWGTETADVVHEDPEDTSSPKMIVYSKGGTLAEIAGDATFDQLKAVAAGMVRVK